MQTIAMHRSDLDQIRDELEVSHKKMNMMNELLEQKEYENQSLLEDNETLTIYQQKLENDNKAMASKVEYCQN